MDLDNITQVDYDLYRGFGPSLGLSTNNLLVFAADAGLNYVLLRPALMFIINPTMVLTTGHNLRGIIILEYRPRLKKKLNPYTRLQAYHSYNVFRHSVLTLSDKKLLEMDGNKEAGREGRLSGDSGTSIEQLIGLLTFIES